jgi:hypothetical protein
LPDFFLSEQDPFHRKVRKGRKENQTITGDITGQQSHNQTFLTADCADVRGSTTCLPLISTDTTDLNAAWHEFHCQQCREEIFDLPDNLQESTILWELPEISVDLRKSAVKFSVFLPGFLVLPVSVLAFNRQPGLYPVLFSSGVIAHVDVSHGHQFTGGLF